MTDATRAEVCAVACAEAWRGDGEVLASAFGFVPAIGARLARATFEPDLVITDGEAYREKGDLDKALADLNEALQLDIKNGAAAYSRGLVYRAKGEHDNAIQDFDLAIKLDPKNVKNSASAATFTKNIPSCPGGSGRRREARSSGRVIMARPPFFPPPPASRGSP